MILGEKKKGKERKRKEKKGKKDRQGRDSTWSRDFGHWCYSPSKTGLLQLYHHFGPNALTTRHLAYCVWYNERISL
jgi:hypothetical protein